MYGLRSTNNFFSFIVFNCSKLLDIQAMSSFCPNLKIWMDGQIHKAEYHQQTRANLIDNVWEHVKWKENYMFF